MADSVAQNPTTDPFSFTKKSWKLLNLVIKSPIEEKIAISMSDSVKYMGASYQITDHRPFSEQNRPFHI